MTFNESTRNDLRGVLRGDPERVQIKVQSTTGGESRWVSVSAGDFERMVASLWPESECLCCVDNECECRGTRVRP
jgi:hypothetical protein